MTLATVSTLTTGIYGLSGTVPSLTLDSKGRVTRATSVAISIAATQVTGTAVTRADTGTVTTTMVQVTSTDVNATSSGGVATVFYQRFKDGVMSNQTLSSTAYYDTTAAIYNGSYGSGRQILLTANMVMTHNLGRNVLSAQLIDGQTGKTYSTGATQFKATDVNSGKIIWNGAIVPIQNAAGFAIGSVSRSGGSIATAYVDKITVDALLGGGSTYQPSTNQIVYVDTAANLFSTLVTLTTSQAYVSVGTTITAITAGNGTIATVTSTSHPFKTGLNVAIGGVTPTAYNGTWIVSTTSTNTFTILTTATGTVTGAASARATTTAYPLSFNTAESTTIATTDCKIYMAVPYGFKFPLTGILVG